MKNINYKFCDGTINTVTVDEKWQTILEELDKQERRQNWVAEKHNTSLDYLNESGIEFPDEDSSPLVQLVKQQDEKEFNKVLNKLLLPEQVKLLKKIVFEGFTPKEIAEQEKVGTTAIYNRLQRIFKKLETFFV